MSSNIPIETLTAYAVAIASIVAVVVQLLKVGVIDPRTQDSPARDTLVRALTYALNLGALLAVLAWNGSLNGHDALLYVSLALGQSVVSHVAYSTLKSGGNPAPADMAATEVTEA